MNSKDLINKLLNSNDWKEKGESGLLLSDLYSPGIKKDENQRIATNFLIWAATKLEVVFTSEYIEDSLLDEFEYQTSIHFNHKKYLRNFIRDEEGVIYVDYYIPGYGESSVWIQFVKFVPIENIPNW